MADTIDDRVHDIDPKITEIIKQMSLTCQIPLQSSPIPWIRKSQKSSTMSPYIADTTTIQPHTMDQHLRKSRNIENSLKFFEIE